MSVFVSKGVSSKQHFQGPAEAVKERRRHAQVPGRRRRGKHPEFRQQRNVESRQRGQRVQLRDHPQEVQGGGQAAEDGPFNALFDDGRRVRVVQQHSAWFW